MIAQPEPNSAGPRPRAATEASPLIRKAAVLGAGTMGSRIAAHLANAGLPVVLLDIPRGEAAVAGRALKKSKPAAFFDPSIAAHITMGNFDDNLALLADCDWVIEAVTENLAIKQALFEKVAPHLKPDAILTTNTSGIPIASIAAELPEQLRRRCFGTHFFNPPRYMRLVEIIATPETDPRPSKPSPSSPTAAGQGSGLRARHAELHRQPDRRLHHAGSGPADAGRRPHHRRGGRADRHRDRLAAHGNVPAGGPGRAGRAGARGRQFRRRLGDAALRQNDAGAALAGRQNQAGILQERRRMPRARKSGWCWTGRRSNTCPPSSPSSRRSKWPGIPSGCRSGSRNCSRAM